MDGWDAVSSAVAPAQPANNSWDAVSSPVITQPPNTSGIQQTVKDNLSAIQEVNPEGKTPEPQSPSQRLDTGLGMPVSEDLKDGKNDMPLSAEVRGHLMDSYAAGTSQNAGDYMQSALPAAANAASSAPEQSYATVVKEAFMRGLEANIEAAKQTGQAVTGQTPENTPPSDQTQQYLTAPYTLGWPDVKRIVGKTLYGITESAPEIGGAVAGGIAGVAAVGGPEDPAAALSGPIGSGLGAAGVNAIKSIAPTYAQELKSFNGDQEKAWAATKTKVGIGAAGTGISFALFGYQPFESTVKNVLFQAFGAQPAVGAAQQAATNIATGQPLAQGVGQAAFEQGAGAAIPLTAHLILKAAGSVVPGHEALKPIVADAVGKPADSVTPQDINRTIAEGFRDRAPTAQDFHSVAAVMANEKFNNVNNILGAAVRDKETGKIYVGTDHTEAATDYQNKTGQQDSSLKDIYGNLDEGFVKKDGTFIDRDVAKQQFGVDTSQEINELKTAYGKYNNEDAAENLRNIYAATGVRPDQVYEDAKNHPDIASDLAAGRIPVAYDHLREPEKENPNLSKEGVSKSINPLTKIFNPAGMSESARDMATALRQGRGPAAQDVAVIQDTLQKYAKMFAGMDDDERLRTIAYMENRSSGASLESLGNRYPDLQKATDTIRDIYAKMGQKMQEQFPDVGLRRDYFTHQYEDERAAAKFFNKWVAKQGSQRNLQERVFPTLAEAMEAGLKPKTTNLIETVMSYVTNMSNLIAAHKSVELAREFGVADYFERGEQPLGWVPLNGNLSTDRGKILYAPEDAARVYNNDISEKATGPIGDIVDMIQRANNFASKLVLGLSGYHFTATTVASSASDVARATLGSQIKAVTPLANTIGGGKLINAYLGRDELSPELQRALDLAIKNNTINIKQQDYWKAGPSKDYVDVFKNGSVVQELKEAGQTLKEHPITGPVRIIANEIGRVMDTTMKLLFDFYIPRLKISANIAELYNWLNRHPDATPQEQDRAAQDIGNSVDNRFGEMMRDNLFWHQLTRQTLQTALLSYSWVTGGARMLKGISDVGMTIIGKQGLTSNARYLFGMAATYAVLNGVRTYFGTGQAPDNWKDFIYPRTGGRTPEGKEEREVLPSHIGQFTNYLHDGLAELGNEVTPFLKLVYHLISNKDFRGLPITNENNPWFSEQRWDDYLRYVLGEETPITIKTFLQGHKKGSEITDVEKALGARQAPRFITDPEGYEKMMENINKAEYNKKVRSDRKMANQYEMPFNNQEEERSNAP